MARRAAVAVGIVLVALATGCSGQEPPVVVGPEPGPAEAYLDAALGFSTADAAQAALRMEEIVARCMSDQGFEYVPDPGAHHSFDAAEIDPSPGTREFAEQFGYGFAAMPEGMYVQSTPGPNPNDEITAAMTPEGRAAYERALWGAEADAGAEGGGDGGGEGEGEAEADLGGCFRAARDEVWGDRETDPVRAALEDEIARIDAEAAPAEPTVLEAAAQWSECMADAGHPGYLTPAEAEQRAWDAWTAFNGTVGSDPEGGAVAAEGELAGQGELAAREAAVATADWDCRAAADYDAVWGEARNRLQQEYVDAHRAELEAWAESLS